MKCINGWTKEKMKEQIRKKNNGKQAMRSLENGGTACVYETPDGNHCAVGCFIPEGHPGMRCTDSSNVLLAEHPDLLSVMPLDGDNLRAFQRQHDGVCPTNEIIHHRLFQWIDNNIKD